MMKTHPLCLLLLISSISARKIGRICSSGVSCEELENTSSIISYLQWANASHITVEFEASFRIRVSDILHFEDLIPDVESLTFSGVSAGATLSCEQEGESASFVSRGLEFVGIRNVSLVDLTIEHCGVVRNLTKNSQYNYSSALYFENCADISLEGVVVRNSRGSGVTLQDNYGSINFIHCSFESNRIPEEDRGTLSGGSGVLMVLNEASNSIVTFQSCRFLNNNATSSNELDLGHTSPINPGEIFYGTGGGVYLTIYNASNNTVKFSDCVFKSNQGIWGGGLFLLYFGYPEMNKIIIERAIIDDNKSYSKNGGGVDIGFYLRHDEEGRYGDNFMRFMRCNFTRNWSKLYGGGVSVYSTKLLSSDPEIHFLVFEGCMFEGNTALSGSAVDIAPTVDQIHINGVYPVPQFIDCSFESNSLDGRKHCLGQGYELNTEFDTSGCSVTISETGDGTILITGFTVQFLGNTRVANNSGSGIYLSSGIVTLVENSSTTFEGNTGRSGGAMAIMTFANVILQSNVGLNFINNTALVKGGAVFSSSIDPHEYLSSTSCFIQYYKPRDKGDRQISLFFEGNKALSSNGGDDVYTSSSRSCSCEEFSQTGPMETFLCLGSMLNSSNFTLFTDTDHFQLAETSEPSVLSPIVPGNTDYSIPLVAFDEYNQIKNVSYTVIPNEGGSRIEARSGHVSSNRLQFEGDLNETAPFQLEFDNSAIKFELKTSQYCPPGYYLSDRKCVCGSTIIFGIAYCNENINRAFILHGFWIGFCKNGTAICSSHCPLGFCYYSTDSNGGQMLPIGFSNLTDYVCDDRRKGILCAQCKEGHSTFYHSYMFRCGDNSKCDYGVIFYLLSELLPLTLMFFAIIVFDIRFTAGAINGFIFYSQVLDSISIDANGAIPFPDSLDVLTDIHRFIYRTLNFDFFSLENLSFCIWKNATSLDVLAMKYVTIVYAFILVVLLVIFMNTGKCKQAFSCWRPRTITSSAKHGIIAFIVICYSQCARVSFQILSPAYLYGENFTIVDMVVFRKGDSSSFSAEHKRYAIPAIIVIFVMSVIPFLLILYPLVFKVLALFKLHDSKLSNFISRLVPAPLLDSFQSSFKDDCRFFAGLYFLYRLLALAAYAYSPTLIAFYMIVEFQLIIILALHSVVQPYKSKWHNIIDSLIFANLALINSFTLFNVFWVFLVGGKTIPSLKKAVTHVSLSFQALLIYLPLVCAIVYISVFLIRKARGRFCKRVLSSSSLVDSEELPPLREEGVGDKVEYKSFKKKPTIVTNKYTYGY